MFTTRMRDSAIQKVHKGRGHYLIAASRACFTIRASSPCRLRAGPSSFSVSGETLLSPHLQVRRAFSPVWNLQTLLTKTYLHVLCLTNSLVYSFPKPKVPLVNTSLALANIPFYLSNPCFHCLSTELITFLCREGGTGLGF